MYISKNYLKEAIQQIQLHGNTFQKKEISLISATLNELEQNKSGVLSFDVYLKNKNQIRVSILELLDNSNKDSFKNSKQLPTIIIMIIAIIIIIIVGSVLFYLNYTNKEIKPLDEPRILEIGNLHLNKNRLIASSSPFLYFKNKAEEGLVIDKVIQGQSQDKSSLVFDIIIKNNSSTSISPDDFEVKYCFFLGHTSSPGEEGDILKPIAKYIQIIDINITKEKGGKRNSKVIYPVLNISPKKTISIRYQLHYNMPFRPASDWDIYFNLNLNYDNKVVKILPVASWRKLYYTSKHKKEDWKISYADNGSDRYCSNFFKKNDF